MSINSTGAYIPVTAAKSQLTNSTVGLVDPVLGIPLNTSADFLYAALLELRLIRKALEVGLNIQEPLENYYTDLGIAPQSTGATPNFS
jgi:hypothetical protein